MDLAKQGWGGRVCVHVFGRERLKDRDMEVMRLLETLQALSRVIDY